MTMLDRTPSSCSTSSSSSSSSSSSTSSYPHPYTHDSAEQQQQQLQLQVENLTQAEGLWFPDGNLILRAHNTLFKVYGGLLAARSSVFRDMLGFPQPAPSPEAGGAASGGDAMIDGCPVVVVYDEPRDMAWFLRAVFDSSFFEPPPAPTALPILEGILRLALKYDVRHLRRRALAHLQSTFPTTLAEWRARDAQRTVPPVDNTPFAAFRLAREFDLVWLVPSIVYCISSHPVDKTLDCASWSGGVDGCDVAFDVEGEEEGHGHGPGRAGEKRKEKEKRKERIELPWADKRMCILARQRLVMAQTRTALAIMKLAAFSPACEFNAPAPSPASPTAPPSPDTTVIINTPNPNPNPNPNPPGPAPLPPLPTAIPISSAQPTNTCAPTLQRTAELVAAWDMAGLLDYFEDNASDAFFPGLCAACRASFRALCTAQCELLWRELPGMMGVGEWEGLERERRRAME